MRLVLLALAFGSILVSSQQGWLPRSIAWWRQATVGGDLDAQSTMLEGRTATTVLATRQRQGAPPLEPDLPLQDWLRRRLESIPTDAESIAEGARLNWPQYQELIVFKAHGATSEGLLEQIATRPEMGTPDLTHLAVAAEPAALGLGWSATILVGQRLPRFTPETLTDQKQATYYSECTLCGEGQACQIPRHTRSLSLECPHCRRVYAMVAADARGRFRYVNEYLTGYAPPARYPAGQTRLAELMSIWRAVANGCRYTVDAGDDDNDAWQTALETQTLGTGDCEDSSILLADWLLTRKFQVRVALGRYAERGGHAWVVVRLDGNDYLLESTEGAPSTARPPLLSEVGSRYVPELVFDHLAFYIRKPPGDPRRGDYWSDAAWQRVVPRPRVDRNGATVSETVAVAETSGGA